MVHDIEPGLGPRQREIQGRHLAAAGHQVAGVLVPRHEAQLEAPFLHGYSPDSPGSYFQPLNST